MPLYSITCGLDDNCLASSAKNKTPTDQVKLLRFSTQVMNWGTYDFVPSLPPWQWIWHACHNHYHSIEALSTYALYDVSTGLKVADGHKASFCLEDSVCSADGAYKRYFCNLNTQGISTNCGDLYASHLDCQWIDVSDVGPGVYTLELAINPGNRALESDYGNNVARCGIQITTSSYFTVSSCNLSGWCWLAANAAQWVCAGRAHILICPPPHPAPPPPPTPLLLYTAHVLIGRSQHAFL